MTLADIGTYIPLIGVPVAGAVAWIWNEYRKDRKERSETDIARERTYADRLEQRLKARETDIERLTKDLMTARLEGGSKPEDILKAIIDNDPGISWAKCRAESGDYYMVRVSVGYARAILGNAPEFYDNKRDDQIWDAATALMFKKNDELVHTKQEGIHLVEETPRGKFVGRKFPLRLGTCDYVVGIGSYEPVNS